MFAELKLNRYGCNPLFPGSAKNRVDIMESMTADRSGLSQRTPGIEPVVNMRVENLRISRVEDTPFLVEDVTKWHPLIEKSAAALRKTKLRHRGRIQPGENCADMRVSKKALSRALTIMNAIFLLLEAEGYSAKFARNGATVACIGGEEVPFYLYEKVRLKLRVRRRYLENYRCTYEPTGLLEFRAGTSFSTAISVGDSEELHLEYAVHLCVAAMMRKALASRAASRQARILEMRQQRKRQKLIELAKRISKEERKLSRLADTVATWKQSQEIQHFVAELEKVDPKSPRCPRKDIAWIRRQAQRLDPFEPHFPSLLDGKEKILARSRQTTWPILLEQSIFDQNAGLPRQHWRRSSALRRRR